MQKKLIFPIILLLSIATGFGYSAKPADHSRLEIITDQILESELQGNMRVELRSGIPRAIYSPNYAVTNADPETMAREYLAAQSELLRHTDTPMELKYLRTVETPGGYRVQFVQTMEGYEVYKSSIKISLNRQDQVVFVMNGYQPIHQSSNQVKLTDLAAMELAREYLGLLGSVALERAELIAYPDPLRQALWTFKVIVVPGGSDYGDWEVLVDAETGEIIRAEDRACYEDGSAWVFDPDPITSAGALYGQTQFSNAGDADTDSLTAQLKSVILEDLTYSGGMYELVGPYASIIDVEAPYSGLHAQDSSSFHFTRSQPGFEAANTYYHIHNTMKYLNETLGFDVMPYQYAGGVHFDPRALNGDANAYFSSGTGWVAFGVPSGSVDAAEDHAIILHEIGHGIHDWITVGGLSQVEGLSEGLGDYWAQSYTRSLGLYQPEDDEYDYFGMWGLQPFGGPSLRVTDFPNHYPEGLGGEVHYDGQLWASSLMTVWDAIGRTATDMNCWESISMTDGNTNQLDAAFAFIQADQDLYGGANLSGIMPAFISRGYLPGPVVARFDADITGGAGPLTVNFSDLSLVQQPPVASWAWDFDNDGLVDSEEQNPTFTFTEPGLYTVSLTISDGTNFNTSTVEDFISVNAGVLVFDGEVQDWTVLDYSGLYIQEQFEELGIASTYSNRLWSSLVGYEAVFISLGNLGYQAEQGTILSNDDMECIADYLTNGGRLYIEGGSVLAGAALFGNGDYQAFWDLFGVETANFNFDQHYLTELVGQGRSLGDGMSFTSSTQVSSWYIDTVIPNQNGHVVFNEPGYGDVAIQSEGIHGQKTVYSAYSLANLVDGSLQNTRQQLLISILEFFGTPMLSPAFSASVNSGHAPLTIDFSDASGSNPEVISWAWDFNGDGVVDSDLQNPTWTFEEPGDYDIGLTVDNGDTTRSLEVTEAIRVFDGETALAFHNNEHSVFIGQPSSLNVIQGLTVEAWINPTAWGDDNDGDGRIVDKGYYRLFLNKDGSSTYPDSSLAVIIKHEDGTLSKASSAANTIALNMWQYVAVSYDASTSAIHIYINGSDRTLVHTPPTGNIKENGDKDLIIGNSPSNTKSFQGRIDELRIWDRGVSSEEIAAHMTSYLQGDEAGLIAYWPMNEAYGDMIMDATPNANHGSIYFSTWEWGTDFVVPVALQDEGNLPLEHLLVQAYPNPFNATTTLRYNLPEPSAVDLTIYDLRGKIVQSLTFEEQSAGWHKLNWNADHFSGQSAPTGLYFCRIQTRSGSITTKLILLK